MRRRISVVVALTTTTVVVSFVVPLCLLVRTLAEDRALAAADQEARNTAILVAGLSDDPQLASLLDALDQRSAPRTVVLLPGGRLLGEDAGSDEGSGAEADGASGAGLADDPDVRRARAGEAFTTTGPDGARVLLPVVVANGTAVVVTSVDEADLHRGVVPAWLGIGALGVALLGLSLLVAARSARRISAPLRAVADTAHRLREGDLGARADVRGHQRDGGAGPRPQRAGRADDRAARRRARRGRRPLPPAADPGHGPAPRRRGRARPGAARPARRARRRPAAHRRRDRPRGAAPGAHRPRRLLRRRPRRARSAAPSGRRSPRTRAAAWGSTRPRGRWRCRSRRTTWRDLVDVLVDNVFAHTPEGTGLDVAVGPADGGRVVLSVQDEGGGSGVGGTGVGGNGVGSNGGNGGSGVGSTGLGLDIARRTAEGAGGSLAVHRGRAGTRIEVVLPLVG